METSVHSSARGNPVLLLFIAPAILLAGVIGLFLLTNGAGLNVEPAAPIEQLQFERFVLRPGVIELYVQNTSPQAVTLAQVIINDAVWPFRVTPAAVVPRLGQAVITLNYPWTKASAYTIAVFSSNAIAFRTELPVAAETTVATGSALVSFTLIGVYVGVIPVLLGMLWFPAFKRLGSRGMLFLMALTVGLLIYLGIDAAGEALEIAGELGGPFQGVGLIGIGIVSTFMLLDAITRRQVHVGRSDAGQRLTLAFMIAVGIGLHNLGEGLAIGAAYSMGAAALGTFLVIGFIIQNITEGLGIIAPVLKDRPSLRKLAAMGLLGGAPAIIGAWIGGTIFSQPLAVMFLAIGAGAVFEVAFEIGKMIQKEMLKHAMPLTIYVGVTTGMLVLYVTGLLIK